MKGIRSYSALLLSTLLALFWFQVVPAGAETRYVSDELLLSLRAAPSPGARVLDYLRSDTPLEVLGEEGEFVRVRTPEGK